MLNVYDQQRIENAQRSTIRSFEGILAALKDMNHTVAPLRELAATAAKSRSSGVSAMPPEQQRFASASSSNYGGR
jgi:hypothetical protein